jgi:hypothetical protein
MHVHRKAVRILTFATDNEDLMAFLAQGAGDDGVGHVMRHNHRVGRKKNVEGLTGIYV